MSRCYLCDYSPDTPSAFHQGLSLDRHGLTLIKDPVNPNEFICTECLDNSRSWIDIPKEDGEEELELAEDTPTLPLW